MKYTKYEMGPYNLHVIKTDKFKTITVKVNFKRKLVKEEITYRNLLNDLLVESSKKYPTRRLLEIQTEELYDLRVSGRSHISGNYSIISFGSNFLHEEHTEKGMIDKSISFLCDLIFDPKIENNQFDKESFEVAKNALRDEIESYKDNPKNYSLVKMLEAMDEKSSISYQPCGYLKDLEQIDEKKLYDYYETVMRSDLLDIFIIGNVDNDFIKKIITERVKVNTLKKPGISHFIEHDKFRKNPKIAKEIKDINQSRLVLGCKLDNLDEFERKYVSIIYSFILGGGPDSKLFKAVREKNSLCYSISSGVRVVSNILIVDAGIDKKAYDKAVKLIKKELKDIEKGMLDDSDIDKAKATYYNSCKEILDSPGDIINTYVSHEYLKTDLLENRMEQINLITKDMIVKFAKKIHLDTIFLLEGGSLDDKNTSN
jgi:predicted Zn-dependent peptidase